MFEGASGGALRVMQLCRVETYCKISLSTFSTSRIHAKSRLAQRKPKNSGINQNPCAWLCSYLSTFSGQFVAFPCFSTVCLCACHHLFPRLMILRSCQLANSVECKQLRQAFEIWNCPACCVLALLRPACPNNSWFSNREKVSGTRSCSWQRVAACQNQSQQYLIVYDSTISACTSSTSTVLPWDNGRLGPLSTKIPIWSGDMQTWPICIYVQVEMVSWEVVSCCTFTRQFMIQCFVTSRGFKMFHN